MKRFLSFALDTSNECLWHEGTQIALTPKPFAVLRYLVEHPGRLITHDELLDALWPETYVQPQVLRTYILELRKVLGDDAANPQCIQTLPKRGYCFVAPVLESSSISHSSASHLAASLSTHARSAHQAIDSSAPFGPAIVGREEELARLNSYAQQLTQAQRQIVFVTGEAGIGKTALLDAFCDQLVSVLPATVSRGQCVEGFGPREEYYPVMEALAQLCASPDGDRACRILSRMAPAWLGCLGRGPATEPAGSPSQLRMPGDLCAALEELAAERPLVLIFEDLHWADEPTLHLISALARRRAPAGLMVLATWKPHAHHAESDSESTQHPLRVLKQDLLVRRLCVEIALAPLTKASVQQLLTRVLDQQQLPPGLTAFVHQHSEGNPLFAIALLEHLIAQKFLIRLGSAEGRRWQQQVPFLELEDSVPDGLAQMIELEIERLSPQHQHLLEAASLMSVAFPAWAVAAALEHDLAETEEACDALARRLYFLERAGEDELPDGTRSAFYVFAHGLYREVLYQRQGTPRRARRHIRIAERLGQLFAGRDATVAREMAMHFEAAGNWQCAAAALRLAACHAQQRQAHAEASELFEQALRIAEHLSEPDRAAFTLEIQSELKASRETVPGPSASRQKTSGKV